MADRAAQLCRRGGRERVAVTLRRLRRLADGKPSPPDLLEGPRARRRVGRHIRRLLAVYDPAPAGRRAPADRPPSG